MPKITRKKQRVFAGDVIAANNIAQFGSLKAGSPAFSLDPDIIQLLSAFGNGWASAVVSNSAPALQDMNSLFFLISRQLAYVLQTGISEYDSTTSYYIGSLVNDGIGTIYMSVVDDNLGQALSDASKWLNYKSINVLDKSANYTVLNSDYMLRAIGTNAFAITLPQATLANKGRELVIKSAMTERVLLTINTTGGSLIDGSSSITLLPSEMRRFVNNGSSWDSVASVTQRTWNAYVTSSSQAVAAYDRAMFNNTAGPLIATLPATPVCGDEIKFIDARGLFGTNALTIARNGKLINGLASDYLCDVPGDYVATFVDDTYGWFIR